MVDLSKAVKGSKVKFRAGGEAIIEKVSSQLTVTFKEDYSDGYARYATSSGLVTNGLMHPFDIIEVIPPEFDWSTVKAGMAFYSGNGRLCIYQGPYVSKNGKQEGLNVFWFEDGNEFDWQGTNMKRAPEHDIEVPHA